MAIEKHRGERIYFDLTITNTGTDTVPAGYLYITLGEPGGWSGQFNGIDFLGAPLAPGDFISREGNSFIIPDEVPDGTYDIIFSIHYPDGNTIGYNFRQDAYDIVSGVALEVSVSIDDLY